jgi:hypothetical protein
MRFIHRFVPLLVTAGIVVCLESVFTIEWTHPYCLNQSDGPAYGAYGMPLPYWMWNGAVSLEHEFAAHVYVLNIVLLCLLFFPGVQWALNRVLIRNRPSISRGLAVVASLLLVVHAAITILMVSGGWYRPTWSLGAAGYYNYSEFRPVRFGFYRSNAPPCVRSPYWFPEGWRHN